MNTVKVGDRVTFRSMYANGPREITGTITDSWTRDACLSEAVYRVTYRCPWLAGTCAFPPEQTDQHVTEDMIIW